MIRLFTLVSLAFAGSFSITDAKVNLQRSMTTWREMAREVWPTSAVK